jgi:hypothetical protein
MSCVFVLLIAIGAVVVFLGLVSLRVPLLLFSIQGGEIT